MAGIDEAVFQINGETEREAAAEIRGWANAFGIAGDQFVTFQKTKSHQPEIILLDDFLKRMEQPRPEQASLFDGK